MLFDANSLLFIQQSFFKIPIGDLIIWFVVFLFSLSFHESAHAWTSEKFGDYTGRAQGRITLNPIPHINIIGTIALPLMSFMSGGISMFGWAKPVQTNPLLWRDKKKANIMVSAAGPISNFILATIGFLALKIMLIAEIVRPRFANEGGPFDIVVPTAPDAGFLTPLTTLLCIFLILNVSLGIFNLIPIPPLDGSHVLESLLPYEMAEAFAAIRPYGFILLLILIMTPVLDWIFGPVFRFVIMLLYGSS